MNANLLKKIYKRGKSNGQGGKGVRDLQAGELWAVESFQPDVGDARNATVTSVFRQRFGFWGMGIRFMADSRQI